MTLPHFVQDDPVEIEPNQSELEDLETDNPTAKYEIWVFPTDFTLEGLHSKWKAETLRLPDFQRQYVWTMSKASRLIESFLLGLPVPGVFLYREHDTESHLVIDGQQRLLSVFFYMSGEFANGREFKLTKNIRRDWRGRAYTDLEEEDRLMIANSVLRATVIRQLNPRDNTSIFHIFERLNTAGTPLSAQEIRNCLYSGKFNDMLKDMNKRCEAWRAILGASEPSPRQRDEELALRMLALWQKSDEYKEPMKDFLNGVMGSHRNRPEEFLNELRDAFERTCALIVDNLGEKPFHIKAGLNAAAFDSVSVAFAKNSNRIPEDVRDRYERLKADSGFEKATSSATTHTEAVRKRLAIAENILFGSGVE